MGLQDHSGHSLPFDVLRAMHKQPGVIGFNWNEAETLAAAYQRAVQAIVASGYLEQVG